MGMLYKIVYALTILYVLPLHIDNKNDGGNIRLRFSMLCLKSLVHAISFSSPSILAIAWIVSHSLYYEEYFTKAFNSVYAPSYVWIMVGFLLLGTILHCNLAIFQYLE